MTYFSLPEMPPFIDASRSIWLQHRGGLPLWGPLVTRFLLPFEPITWTAGGRPADADKARLRSAGELTAIDGDGASWQDASFA